MSVDYRKLFKSKWFTAADIENGEVTLTVKGVTVEAVQNQGGTEECPTLHFEEHPKPLVLNKTNARSIAAKHGADADEWVGKAITFRESVTTFGGEEVPCVRVK